VVDVVRHRKPADGAQPLDHLVDVDPLCRRVPQRQRAEPIGVHVLGRLLDLGASRQEIARLFVSRGIDLDQDGPVPLYDRGPSSDTIHPAEASR